jgi:hypothetical protein
MQYNTDENIKETENNGKIEENNNIFSDNISNNDTLITKKKKLIDISKNLTKIEYLEIFNIIQNDGCSYSENKNGIFINLMNVSEDTIDKIFNFIDFIKHKKEDLIKHEEYVNNFKKNMNENEKTTYLEIKEAQIIDDYTYDSDENQDNDNDNKFNYLTFSSDEEEDLENKISLKKKKIKYTGKKAKIIRSIKDNRTLYSQS